MPYEWKDTAPEDSGAVSHRLTLWPHRSLPRRGFAWFIGTTAALMVLPLVALLGTIALWGLLPFAIVAIWAIWTALQRSYRSGEVREELHFSRDYLKLWRSDPGKEDRMWQTNPYWVRVALWTDGPVDAYLTLTDGQRKLELGAFLSPDERRELYEELKSRLAHLR